MSFAATVLGGPALVLVLFGGILSSTEIKPSPLQQAKTRLWGIRQTRRVVASAHTLLHVLPVVIVILSGLELEQAIEASPILFWLVGLWVLFLLGQRYGTWALTIYPLGVDRVGREWDHVDGAEVGPRFMPRYEEPMVARIDVPLQFDSAGNRR